MTIVVIAIVALGVLILLNKLRKPPPQGTPLNPEDRNLDFYRRLFPDPSIAKAQAPTIDELMYDYVERRNQEEKRAGIRRNLDKQNGIGIPPNPPPQPSPNP